MKQTLSKATFYLLAVIAVAWSASLSYSFLSRVLVDRHWLVPLAGLVIAELGAVAWSVVYIHQAKGTSQRSTALVMTVASLAAVSVMTAAEILTGGQTIADAPALFGPIAVWAIAALTAANVIAVVVFHLVEPENRRQMALQAAKDALFDESLARLDGKRQDVSATVSDAMAGEMMAQLLTELRQQDAGKVPIGTQSTIVDSKPVKFSMNQDGQPAPKVESK